MVHSRQSLPAGVVVGNITHGELLFETPYVGTLMKVSRLVSCMFSICKAHIWKAKWDKNAKISKCQHIEVNMQTPKLHTQN